MIVIVLLFSALWLLVATYYSSDKHNHDSFLIMAMALVGMGTIILTLDGFKAGTPPCKVKADNITMKIVMDGTEGVEEEVDLSDEVKTEESVDDESKVKELSKDEDSKYSYHINLDGGEYEQFIKKLTGKK